MTRILKLLLIRLNQDLLDFTDLQDHCSPVVKNLFYTIAQLFLIGKKQSRLETSPTRLFSD